MSRREAEAGAALERAEDSALTNAEQKAALDEAVQLDADLLDDPKVDALSKALEAGATAPASTCAEATSLIASNPDAAERVLTRLATSTDAATKSCAEEGLVRLMLARVADGTDRCELATRLIDVDRDVAEPLLTQMSKSANTDLKACGESGLLDIQLQRAEDAQQLGLERAESWWDSLVDNLFVPLAEFVGQALVIALAVLAAVKLLGLLPMWDRWAQASVALMLLGAGIVLAMAFYFVAGDGTLPQAIAYGFLLLGALLVAGGAVLKWELQERGSWRGWANKLTLVSAIVALITAIVWIEDELTDPGRMGTEDWWNVVALGTVAVTGLVALVLLQASRVRLVIDPFGPEPDKAGKEFAVIVRERFLTLGSGGPSGLELVSGTDQGELPADAMADLAPNKIIAGLLKVARAVTPATTYRLTGELHSSTKANGEGGDVVGVTVSLKRAMRPPAMARIDPGTLGVDQGTTATPSNRPLLATAVAAWLVIELLDRSPGVRNEFGRREFVAEPRLSGSGGRCHRGLSAACAVRQQCRLG